MHLNPVLKGFFKLISQLLLLAFNVYFGPNYSSSSALRPSSTLNVLRREEPALRRSSGELLSLAPAMSPWTPALTRTQTQRERTAQ